MLPHAELDNYKLQVELLQEKLKRSEENREKLEHKLENTLHKKSEHEKIVRAKQRQKYEEFVNELEKRNERNRQLKQMLERIDQQTTALSARSERLRMMKMQYEMYFAKLVQSQTMRCIQGTTSNLTAAPTTIPILVPATPPTQQSTVITATSIKNNEHDPTTSNAKAAATSSAIYQCDASGNLIAASTAPQPMSSYTVSQNSHIVQEMPVCNTISIPTVTGAGVRTGVPAAAPLPALTAGTQHWTLAMATPTPSGMLLTTTPTMGVIPSTTATSATPDFVSVPAYDYMQYPFGYMPRMRHLLQPKPNTPIYSDESDDLLQPMDANTKSDHHHTRTNKQNDRDNLHAANEQNTSEYTRIDNNVGGLSQMDLPTRQLDNDKSVGALLGATEMLRKDNVYEHQQQEERQKPEHLLSNVSTTSSASWLTLDKLPKTMTMTEHANAAATAAAAAASTPIDERNNNADDGGKPQLATRFDEASKGISIIDYDDKGALPTQRKDEEKSLPEATNTPNTPTTRTTVSMRTDDSAGVIPCTVISNDNGNAIEEDLRRKIDNTLPYGQQQHMTQSWHKTESVVNNTEPMMSGNRDNALNNAPMTGGFMEYAENKVTNNGLNSGSDILPTAAKVSIEKIENEIYGELVNPPTGETDKNDARYAAQGLVNELVTQQQPQEQQIQLNQSGSEQILTDIRNDGVADYGNYAEIEQHSASDAYEQSNSESYDPTYATIEGTTDAEVYQQPDTELAYTDDQNASNNYAQYTADPNAVQQQQDYNNVDYANYDAAQYNEAAAYDPNAYPGYTYDTATGQYTPDSTQQYTNEDGTIAYNAQGEYEQQQYDASQQNQDYDYTNYTQEADETNAAYAVDTAEPIEQADNQMTTIPANLESKTPPVTTKPTSILSSAEKHAAANDAQKKKKRVNFVDSSETDDSSSVKQSVPNTSAGNESDFDFSSSDKSGGN